MTTGRVIQLSVAETMYLNNRVDQDMVETLQELVGAFPEATPCSFPRRLYERLGCFHLNYGSTEYSPEEIIEYAAEIGLTGAVDEWPCIHWPRVKMGKEQLNEVFPEPEYEDEDED